MNTLIEQMSAQIDVLNALIEDMRWRNERIAKAIARAKAAEEEMAPGATNPPRTAPMGRATKPSATRWRCR